MRVRDFETRLMLGDYANVIVKSGISVVEGAVVRVNDGCYFLSASRKYDGNRTAAYECKLERYPNSWCLILDGWRCATLRDCESALKRDFGDDCTLTVADYDIEELGDRLAELFGTPTSNEDLGNFFYSIPVTDKGCVQVDMDFYITDKRFVQEFLDKVNSNWLTFTKQLENRYGAKILLHSAKIPFDLAKSSENWMTFTNSLYGKTISWDASECGLRVTIDKSVLGGGNLDEKLTKLWYFYYAILIDAPLTSRIFGRGAFSKDYECVPEYANAIKQLGSIVLRNKEIRSKCIENIKDNLNAKKRAETSMVIHDDTIEFKLGRGSMRPARIAVICDFCEMIVKYVASTPWQQLSVNDFNSFAESKKSYICSFI
jgi:hypothetical protein